MAKTQLIDKFHRELFDGLDEGICLVNEQYKIVFANTSFQKSLQYAAEELLQLPLEVLHSNGENNEKEESPGNSKTGKNGGIPPTLQAKDGTEFCLEKLAQKSGNSKEPWVALRLKPTERLDSIEENTWQQQERMHADMMDATDDILFVFDLENKVLQFNKAAARAVEFFHQKTLTKGMSGIFDFGDEKLQEFWKAYHQKVLSGEICHAELPVEDAKGHEYVFDLKMHPFIQNGKTVGKVVYARDITQKKQEENNLLKITKAIEEAGEAIGITDNEGTLIYINKKFAELTECDNLEVFKKAGGISGRFADQALAHEIFELIKSGKSWKGEATLKTISGKEFVALLKSDAIFDENQEVIGLLGTFSDITQRKKDESYLKLLESSVNNANDIIIITDGRPIDEPEGPQIIYVNEAFVRQTGFSMQEALGSTPRILQGDKTDRNELDKIRFALENWKPVEVELINYRKDGSYFWSNLSIFPVGYQNGWYTHWVAIQKDITARKLAEEKLRQSRLRYQSMSENFPNGYILLLDKDYRILFTEGKRYSDKNIHPGFLVGKKIHEITQTDNLPILDKHLNLTFLGYQQQFEMVDGEEHLLFNTTPIGKKESVEEILVFVSNISELKLAQTQLMANEANLKVLIDSSVQATFLLSRNFEILLFNKVAQNLIMLNNGIKIKIGRSILTYPFPGSLHHFRQYLTSCLEGVRLSYEYKVTHPITRQNIWYDTQFMPVFNQEGEATGISLSVVNITQRKISEEKLRKGEATLKAIFDSASQSTLLIDIENKIIDFNKIAQKHAEIIWGKELERGKSILFYTQAGKVPNFEDYYKNCLKGDRVKQQIQVSYAGSERYFDILFLPVYDDQSMIGVSFSAQEITEKVLAEKKLHDYYSQIEHLQYALDASSLVSKSDIDGKIIEVNDNMVEISGYSREELIGEGYQIFNSGFHSSEFFGELWSTILSGNIWKGEIKNKTKNGNDYWVYSNIIPLLDNSGKPFQFIVIRNDITGKKAGEEELLSANAMLKKTNEELDQFVYSVSHQLRSPISSVLGLLNVMRIENKADKKHNKYVDLMEKSMLLLDDTIHEIENYSRNARLYLELEPIDLSAMIDHVISSLSFIANYNKIEIIKEYRQVAKFYSDPHRLKIIFSNIFSNAIKYQDPRKENPQINIKLNVDNKYAEIIVADNGIGIESMYLSKIFHMYYRISEKMSGSGLGLYVVQETVDKLGGSIQVSSIVEKGSTFTIRLPNDRPQEF